VQLASKAAAPPKPAATMATTIATSVPATIAAWRRRFF
jgi:hypothetical protein